MNAKERWGGDDDEKLYATGAREGGDEQNEARIACEPQRGGKNGGEKERKKKKKGVPTADSPESNKILFGAGDSTQLWRRAPRRCGRVWMWAAFQEEASPWHIGGTLRIIRAVVNCISRVRD